MSTGVPSIDTAAVWAGVLVAVAGALGVLYRASRGARQLIGRLGDLADDWLGTPARPGVPERPGVMQRLGSIDNRLAGLDERVAAVEHELHPNSGSSLRDAVDRVDDRTRLIVGE